MVWPTSAAQSARLLFGVVVIYTQSRVGGISAVWQRVTDRDGRPTAKAKRASNVIDTKHVKARRTLHFASGADVLADARRCVEADERGELRRTGNWTLGQNLGHLASWIEYGYSGYPMAAPSWIIRAIVKLMRKRFLSGPPMVGFKIKGVAGGTYGTEDMSGREGLDRLTKAWAKLDAAAPSMPSPVFGAMTHEEWKMLHLRHAEGHLSFLHPEGR